MAFCWVGAHWHWENETQLPRGLRRLRCSANTRVGAERPCETRWSSEEKCRWRGLRIRVDVTHRVRAEGEAEVAVRVSSGPLAPPLCRGKRGLEHVEQEQGPGDGDRPPSSPALGGVGILDIGCPSRGVCGHPPFNVVRILPRDLPEELINLHSLQENSWFYTFTKHKFIS